MKTQKLWFIRSGDRVLGPFPAKLVARDLLLGRHQPGDEASVDQVFWTKLEDLPELQPKVAVKHRVVGSAEAPLDWLGERRAAAKRWADERTGRERRGESAAAPLAEKRRRDRRQQQEDAEVLAVRQRHAEWEQELRYRRDRFIGVSLLLLALLALAVYAVFNLSPVNPIQVDFHGPSARCGEPAVPQTNWTRCDKSGAWLKGVDLSSAMLREARFNAANLSFATLSFANLSGADLSFANLQQAKLNGANLSQANLIYAELRDADLRQADLRGAQVSAATLIGARLDDAIWVDGRRCAFLSVGECK